MLIKKIQLDNFRSYVKKDFEFSPGVTLVLGPNTAGKSNLLEAIFLLAFGKSPRADLDREMVKSVISDKREVISGGENSPNIAFVRATVSGSEDRDLEVALTETGKRFRVNGIGRRRADFSQHFHVVLFSPEDLNLVTGSPDRRRRFMVFALESVDPAYSYAVTQYDQVRKRRNRLLEKINKGESPSDELGFWDAKFLEHGVLIQDKRKEFFAEVNLSLITYDLSLNYLPSGLTPDRLAEYRPREIAAETSLIGPHRDDFSFVATSQSTVDSQQLTEGTENASSRLIALGDSNRELLTSNRRDLAAFGSRGEQRRAVLHLKKAELEFVEKRIESRPVLLLDDIFSELDEENRARVFDLIAPRQARGDPEQGRRVGGQTIITTTDLDHVPAALQKDLPVIRL